MLVVGIDPNVAGMVEASRRASRPLARGGLPNALFVIAAAEDLPRELDGRAGQVSVTLPWGSLLRGLLHADESILSGLSRVTLPDARVALLLSVTARDGVDGWSALDAASLYGLTDAYALHGLRLLDARPATVDEIRATNSTWAKRLALGHAREAWRLGFVRDSLNVSDARREITGETRGPDSARIGPQCCCEEH